MNIGTEAILEVIKRRKDELTSFCSKAIGQAASLKTIGHGTYGWVMDIVGDGENSGYVLKVTSDPSEALGWFELQKLDLPGVVKILAVWQLPERITNAYNKLVHPVAVVREKVIPLKRNGVLIHRIEDILDQYNIETRYGGIDKDELRRAAQDMLSYPPTHILGSTIITILENGFVPSDLHPGNLGRRGKDVVIFDPSLMGLPS